MTPSLSADIAYAENHPGWLTSPSQLHGLTSRRSQTVSVPPPPAETSVVITHRDRVIFPESDLTKGNLADYYAVIAPLMLPFVRDPPGQPRPLPTGRGGENASSRNMMRAVSATMSAAFRFTTRMARLTITSMSTIPMG